MDFENFQNNFINLFQDKEYQACLKLIYSNKSLIEEHLNRFPSVIETVIQELNNLLIENEIKLQDIETLLNDSHFKNIYVKFTKSDILIRACKDGNKTLINELLNFEMDLNNSDENGKTALMYAMKYPTLINQYDQLYTKDNLNMVDNNNENIIFHALHAKNIDALRWIAYSRYSEIDPNVVNKDHLSTFHYCIKYDVMDAIYYISHMKDIDCNIIDSHGWMPVMYLVDNAQYEYIKYIKNPDMTYTTKIGENVLTLLLKHFEESREAVSPIIITPYLHTFKALVNKQWNFNIPIDEDGNSFIHYLIMIEDFCSLYYVITNCTDNLDLSYRNKNGDDAYSLALKLNNKSLIKFIGNSKAYNLNYTDEFRNNLLMFYIMNNNIDMVNLISLKNPDLTNDVNDKKEHALIVAVKLGSRLDIIKRLLFKGSNVDHQDYLGNTALYYAVDLQNEKVVHLLLYCKANPHIKNNRGKSAYDLALEYKAESLVSMMENTSTIKYNKKYKSSHSFPSPHSKKDDNKRKLTTRSTSYNQYINMHTLEISKYRNDIEFIISNVENRYKPLPHSDVIRTIGIEVYRLQLNRNSSKVVGVNQGRIMGKLIIEALALVFGLAIQSVL